MVTVDQALNRKRTSFHTAILACAAMGYQKSRNAFYKEYSAAQKKMEEIDDMPIDCYEFMEDELDMLEFYEPHYSEKHGFELYRGIRQDVAKSLGVNMDPSFHVIFNHVLETRGLYSG